MDLPGKWVDRVRQHRSLDKLILDLNSPVSQTYGRRERHESLALWCRAWRGYSRVE